MSIAYPFVNYQNEKSLYVIRNNELCETIPYVEQYGLIYFFLILVYNVLFTDVVAL